MRLDRPNSPQSLACFSTCIYILRLYKYQIACWHTHTYMYIYMYIYVYILYVYHNLTALDHTILFDKPLIRCVGHRIHRSRHSTVDQSPINHSGKNVKIWTTVSGYEWIQPLFVLINRCGFPNRSPGTPFTDMVSIYIRYKVWDEIIYPFTITKLQRCSRWCLGMDKWFNATLYKPPPN